MTSIFRAILWAACVPALALTGSSTAPLLAQTATGAGTTGGTVTVNATNLRSAKGVVRACMTTNAKRFPRCSDDPNSHRMTVPAANTVSFTFTNVASGKYAIALLHDENANGKADRALSMIPKEGFGFSRDAKVRMGPPNFRDAVFDFAGDSASQTIRMRYLL